MLAKNPPTAAAATTARRRSSDLHRQILGAAERAVTQSGHSASVDLIAREAGVSRSVLYRHFSSRDELIRQATLGPFRRFLDDFRSVCNRANRTSRLSDWDLERAFMTGLVDHFRAHRDLLQTVLSDRSVLPDGERRALCAEFESTLDEIAGFIAEEITVSGRDIPLETVGVKLRLEIAMVAGLITNAAWLLPSGAGEWSTAELLDHLTEFTLYGAQTAPERRPSSTPRRRGQKAKRATN